MLQLILTILLFIYGGNLKTMTRIYNGHPDSQHSYPYVMGIEYLGSNGYMRHCSGTLIAEYWILTAGHCVNKRLNLVVAYGNRTKENSTERLKVIYQTQHPFTNLHDVNINDIALMKVEKNPNKTIANLASTDYRESFGLTVVYAGFGITWPEKKLPVAEWKKRMIQLNSSPLLIAEGVISRCTLLSFVHPRMCVLSNGTTTIGKGDSGGPLIYQNSVIAVASGLSYGINKNRYLVFVPVIYYLYWIKDVIEKNKYNTDINTKITN